MQTVSPQKTILLIGASRGLGLAMTAEYLKRGWRVIATGRATSTDRLRHLAGALEVETVDITIEEQVAGLTFPCRPSPWQ
jgi:NAD(P)-dependent dehydrogenase (short-subunit alcohol dehydrogenase family)